MKFSRRKFVKTAGAGVVVSAFPVSLKSFPYLSGSASPTDSIRLAIAGFSFLKINLELSLAMMKRLGVTYMSVKDFHLPVKSTKETIDQTVSKMKTFGVEPYGVGPIYLKSEESVDQAFAYAKMVGVNLLIGVPYPGLLNYVEQKVKEYNIRFGIHNHGPDLDLYSSTEEVWDDIKNLDSRIGLCHDIAHTTRLGLDPIEAVIKYRDRTFDFHIWDVDKPEKEGKCIEAGRGIVDFPKFFRTLREIKYNGTCSLEWNGKDMTDPLPDIAESIGYFRGVLTALNK